MVKRNPKDIFFVSIQLVLFFVYLFRLPKIDFTLPGWLQLTGIIMAIIGVIIAVAGLITLKKTLSPFPTPKENAELIQSGVYKFIRHPIYTGILFFTFGYSIYSENTLRLLIFFGLLVLFIFKATYEEKLLEEKFPNYTAYKKTAGMFWPWLK